MSVFETPVYLILMTLSSWFFPDAASVAYVEQRPGQTARIVYSVKSQATPQYLAYYGLSSANSKEMPVMGRYSLTSTHLTWQFGTGQGSRFTETSLGQTIADFSTLDAKSVSSLALTRGGALTVTRQADAIGLSAADGTTYHFYRGHIPAHRVSGSSEPVVPYRATSKSMKGWLLYGAPLQVKRTDPTSKGTVNKQDAGAVVIGFLSGLMNGNSGYEAYVAKSMPVDIKAALKTHGDALGKTIERYDVHGFVEESTVKTMAGGQGRLLQSITAAVGSVDRIFFVEINGAANDAFVVVGRDEDGFGVRAVVSQWAETLLPVTYQEKMKSGQD